MNPELWQKPYDYSFEEHEIKTRFLKYFENLTQAKRITHEPFKNTTNIRCTFQSCKIRYAVPELLFQQVADKQPKDFFRFTAGVHDHFLTELGFSKLTNSQAFTSCKNGKQVFICDQCGYAPFPKPMGAQQTWYHNCIGRNKLPMWLLYLNKPGTMIFRQTVWILQIDYVDHLWKWLLKIPQAVYDPKASCWLIPDANADLVEKACKEYWVSFKRGAKPTKRSSGPNTNGRAIGALNIRKASAAQDIVRIIAENGAFRAVQAKLHPDRFPEPSEHARMTKIYQDLQEAWNRWEKS